MNRIVAAVASLVVAVTACAEAPEPTSAASTAANPDGTPAALEYVLDGDSIEVEANGRTVEVRLIGINAPEGDECFGDESRGALIEALDAGELVLVEGADSDTDRYGRLLRYVYSAGENVNGRMLAEGNAVALQSDHRSNDSFVEIGDLAADAGAGMWAPDACGSPPPPDVSIIEVAYNPPGPDDDRLNEESVTISNGATAAVDLDQWTLRDESSQNRYVFGGVILAAGDRITVRTGCGADDAGSAHWCADRPVWSNSGDTVMLQDPNGNVADRWRYRGDR